MEAVSAERPTPTCRLRFTLRPMNSTPMRDFEPDVAWQQANEVRLRVNARRWAENRETTLYTESWEGYFVAVTREGQRLVLWMMDAEVANTDWIQSALDLREPLRLQSSYTQAMILSLLWQPAPGAVFLSGLGGGCLATMLHHHLTQSNFVCVEIAPPVATAATRFFGFQPDDRLSLTMGDAREFLQRDEAKYDLMLLDIFCDHGVSPGHVVEADFFCLCRERLHSGGLLAINLGNNDPAFERVASAFGELFPTVYACLGRGSTTVLFATDQPPRSPAMLLDGTVNLERRHDFRFALTPWTSRLKQLQPPRQERADDYPPSLDGDMPGTSAE